MYHSHLCHLNHAFDSNSLSRDRAGAGRLHCFDKLLQHVHAQSAIAEFCLGPQRHVGMCRLTFECWCVSIRLTQLLTSQGRNRLSCKRAYWSSYWGYFGHECWCLYIRRGLRNGSPGWEVPRIPLGQAQHVGFNDDRNCSDWTYLNWPQTLRMMTWWHVCFSCFHDDGIQNT